MIWMRELTEDLRDGQTDPEPGSLIETGFGPAGEIIYRNKKPIGYYKDQNVWLVHVQSIDLLENLMGKESKLITWKQAKIDKANSKLDFIDEIEDTVDVEGELKTFKYPNLHVIAGGGAPDNLEFAGQVEDELNPVVEIVKDKDGNITKVKEKDK